VPVAVEGALVGLGVALFLLVAEYMLMVSAKNERARRTKRPPKFEDAERRRIATMARFCLFMPPAFAAFYWLIWG
jgi:hypothetical protein